ncbi:MAG: thioredoxin fold domain-containing protein [Phycisphaerae bacterium]
MKRASLAVFLAVLVAGPALAAKVEGFDNSWADAVAKAKKEGKPIYLHFTTEWCGWCRKIEADTYKSDKGKKALENFVPASLDCTVPRGQQPTGETKTNIELMRKWGGSGYPFLVMVTPEGTVLNTVSGYVPPEQFVKETDKALETRKQLKEFKTYAEKADTSSLQYNKKAMEIYSQTLQWDKAIPAIDVVMEKAGDDKDLYQNAAMIKIDYLMNQLRSAKTEQEGKKILQKLETTLTGLTGKDLELQEPFKVYYMLGGVAASLGNNDKAVTALEKALEHAPNDRAKQAIQSTMTRVKAQSQAE